MRALFSLGRGERRAVVRLLTASSLALVAGVGIGLLLGGGEERTTATGGGTQAAVRVAPRGPAGVPAERRFLPASGTAPEQVLVSWNGSEQRRRGAYESGLAIWQRAAPSLAAPWRVVHSERFPSLDALNLEVGDVTRDGHEDILVEASQGTAGCGVRHVLATVSGRVREIYRSPRTCEASYFISEGRLSIAERIGPCPYPGPQSAHCRGGERRTVRAWNGDRLVAVRTSVVCDLPRLDPARGCRARR
jgi:hypothetical protein